jgi:hypothetical protein
LTKTKNDAFAINGNEDGLTDEGNRQKAGYGCDAKADDTAEVTHDGRHWKIISL